MPSDPPELPASARHARLFRNGRNQAVRIPRELELATNEVMIYREDDRLVMVPVGRPSPLAEVLKRLVPPDEEFPEISDPPVKPEDFL